MHTNIGMMDEEKFMFANRFIPFHEVTTLKAEEIHIGEYKACMLNPLDNNQTFSTPKFWFHPPGRIGPSKWKFVRGPGLGIANTGNSCFANAALQALIYCPPLAQDFLQKSHSRKCERRRENIECVCCVFEEFLNRIFRAKRNDGTPSFLKPQAVLRHLVGKGQSMLFQHDTHEALTALLEKLRRCDLPIACERDFERHLIPNSELSTSYLNQLLVGFLVESMVCLVCSNASKTFQPFWDIIVSIQNCSSLEKALEIYFTDEYLRPGNEAWCDNCGKKQRKKITRAIYKPPNILTVVFQRVGQCTSGGLKKVRKNVSIPLTVNMSPFRSLVSHEYEAGRNSSSEDEQCFDESEEEYTFCSAIAHSGCAAFGHYITYCRAPNDQIYCFDDEDVRLVNIVRDGRLELPYSSVYLCMFVRNNQVNRCPDLDAAILYSDLLDDDKSSEQLDSVKSVACSTPNTRACRGLSIPEALAKAANRKLGGGNSEGIFATVFIQSQTKHAAGSENENCIVNAVEDPTSPKFGPNALLPVASASNSNLGCEEDAENDISNGTCESRIKAQRRNKSVASHATQFGNSNVELWECGNPQGSGGEHFERFKTAQEFLQPKPPKRSSHDRQYDKGKLKKTLRTPVVSQSQKRKRLRSRWKSSCEVSVPVFQTSQFQFKMCASVLL